MEKDFSEAIKREKYIALNAQPPMFRLVKWIIIICLFIGLVVFKGWAAAGLLILFLAVVGTSFHFFLRWKTKSWTQPWGPYKKALLDKKTEPKL